MAITLKTAGDDDRRRLDRILRRALPELPLSLIHRLLRKGRVLVDGRPGEAADRIPSGALIVIPGEGGKDAPSRSPREGGSTEKPGPAGEGLNILREAGGLLFLNKPPGLAVHGPGSLNTLVQSYLEGKIPPSLSFKPGPLHRLDKPTSGVIVFSSSLEGARYFSTLLRERRIKKRYLALADGKPDKPAVWEDPLFRDSKTNRTLGGTAETAKNARTRVFPLAFSSGYSLIMAEIETGRTHQIRAQGAIHGFPLAGDRKYGGSPLKGGFLLHAYTLEFTEPGNTAPLIVSAPLPEQFLKKMMELFPEKYKKYRGVSLPSSFFHDIL
jgi:23S rRNA pseudouridine955/2504/2580 synthase